MMQGLAKQASQPIRQEAPVAHSVKSKQPEVNKQRTLSEHYG
jgi:hypothetical protein